MMTQERMKELEVTGGALTSEETEAGWHYCPDWDYMLIGPDDAECESCLCDHEPKIVYQDYRNLAPIQDCPPKYYDRMHQLIGGWKRCEVLTIIAVSNTGKSMLFEGMRRQAQMWVDAKMLAEEDDPKKKVYGPVRKGKGGKVKKW